MRMPQRRSTGGSTSSSTGMDLEASAASSSSLHSVSHPLSEGGSPLSPTCSRSQDPLLDTGFDDVNGSDDESQFILVNGQLFRKPATPADAPPPYAPYPAGSRQRAQTFPAGTSAVRLPPLPHYRQTERSTETTPLLASSTDAPRRIGSGSTLGYIFRGDERGYWSTLCDKAAWRSLAHLLVISFFFNLLLWPFLLAGTVVGTALLVTLPLGAVFWFLTLLLARAGAVWEMRQQICMHDVDARPTQPIFYRQRVREDGMVVWDQRFLSCSWAMFTDQYSYSALVYLLLIKPLIVIVSGLTLLVLFILSAVLFPLLPIFLRLTRSFGQWQARVALDNL